MLRAPRLRASRAPFCTQRIDSAGGVAGARSPDLQLPASGPHKPMRRQRSDAARLAVPARDDAPRDLHRLHLTVRVGRDVAVEIVDEPDMDAILFGDDVVLRLGFCFFFAAMWWCSLCCVVSAAWKAHRTARRGWGGRGVASC